MALCIYKCIFCISGQIIIVLENGMLTLHKKCSEYVYVVNNSEWHCRVRQEEQTNSIHDIHASRGAEVSVIQWPDAQRNFMDILESSACEAIQESLVSVSWVWHGICSVQEPLFEIHIAQLQIRMWRGLKKVCDRF